MLAILIAIETWYITRLCSDRDNIARVLVARLRDLERFDDAEKIKAKYDLKDIPVAVRPGTPPGRKKRPSQ